MSLLSFLHVKGDNIARRMINVTYGLCSGYDLISTPTHSWQTGSVKTEV